MTIKTLLQNAAIDQLDAELLIAHVLQQPREFVISHLDNEVGAIDQWKIKKLFKKRKNGMPLAHLTGHKEFFGLDFFVNKHVLVPRPDTEVMVSLTLDRLQSSDFGLQTVLIDVGTGSGCIPISVIKSLKHKQIKTIATDISKKALAVAKKNATKHDVDISFLHGNLLEPIIKSSLEMRNYKLVITANLPYLTEQQFQSEPSIQQELKLALVAEDDGLALYNELLQQLKRLKSEVWSPTTLFLEIDPTQSPRITTLIQNHFPDAKIEIKKDLSGLERVVCVEISAL